MTDLETLRNKISQVKSKPVHNEEDSDVRRIYNYCVHLLARQDYSEHKLRQKLRSKPQNLPHLVEGAILKIKEKGLLREEAYRKLFIRKWMMKGESEDKIRKRGGLEKLCFEDDEFQLCSEELGFRDEDSLEKLIAKKLRSQIIPKDVVEKSKLRDKVLRFLISKGHSFEESKKAISRYIDQQPPLED